MVRKLLLLVTLLGWTSLAYAQLPPPCPTNDYPPADLCSDICIYCDFNGIMSTTAGYTGQTPPGFCGTIENEQWLGFIAGASSATFTATASNCTMGNGIQIALYTDCNSTPVGCYSGCNGCSGIPATITVSLTPGVNYFLLVDGFAGDQCDFTISVQPPSAVQAPQVGPTGLIAGPAQICPGATVTYTIPVVSGAGGYIWTGPPGSLINGEPGPVTVEAPGGNTVEITFGNSGGQICVQPVNSCDDGDPVCRNVVVQPIPPTILPDVTVCAEEAPYTLPWGDLVGVTGNYQTTELSYQGCDSVIRQRVVVRAPIIRTLAPTTICAGNCVTICGEEYCDGGSYSHVCESYEGCDSLVNFSILLLQPEAEILTNGQLSCSNPCILLNSAPSAGTKVWKNLAGQVLGTGNTLSICQPGTVILTVTASAGGQLCVAADTVDITGDLTPPTISVTGGIIGCGSSTTILGVNTNATNPTFSWSGPNGFTSNLPNPEVGVQGNYSVTVTTSSNGCTNSATAIVTGNTIPPDVTTVGGIIDCDTDTIQISANSNVGNATFVWSGPGGFSDTISAPNVGLSGFYFVTVTDPSNGCTTIDTAQVVLDDLPPGAVANGGVINCISPSINLTGSTQATNPIYGWTGPGGFTSSEQNPSVGLAGTYILTVTGTNGCTSTSNALVVGNTNPPGALAAGGTINCADPDLNLSGNSDSTSVTWAWTGPGGFSSNQQNPLANTPGSYILIVTGSNSCTSTDTTVIDGDFVVPDVMAEGDTISCSANSVTITGSSTTTGVIYSWTGPNGFTSSLQNPVVTSVGTYTLQVIAPNGCTNTATALVTPDTGVPDVSATGGTLDCNVTSLTLDGNSTTPNTVFSWTGPGGFTSSEEDPLINLAGMYTLVVTSLDNNCTAQVTINVNLNDAEPGATATGNTLSCNDPSLPISGDSPTGSVTWNWTGPGGFTSTDQSPIVDEAGDYILVVTGPNGCTSSATAVVNLDIAPPGASAVSSNDLDCDDLNADLTASAIPNAAFVWSGPNGFTGNTAIVTVSNPGTYQVTVTGPNGCTSETLVDVGQDITPPGATAAGDTIDCFSGIATIIGNSNTSGVTWAWTGPGGFTSNLQNPQVSVTGTYNLVVTGLNACTSTATAMVIGNTASPVVSISGGGTLTCTDISLPVTGTISTPGATGVWTGPGGVNSPNPTINVTIPGLYSYTVTATNGCVTVETINVPQDIVPPQNVTATGGLLNCNFPTIALGGNSGTAGVTWSWSGPGGFTSTLQNPTVSNPGNYILVVTNPVNGCTASASTLVDQDPTVPDILVTTGILDCNNTSVLLESQTTTPDVTFAWSGPGGFTSTEEDPVISNPGSYTVVVTAQSGCTASFTIQVDQDVAKPDVSATGLTLTCNSPSGTITGNSNTPGVVYSWSGPGGFTSALASPTVTLTGAYVLTVTAPNGCTNSATVQVVPDASIPQVSVTGGTVTCIITSVQLTAMSNVPDVTWAWTGPGGFTSNLQNPTVSAPGGYTLIVTATNGCTNSTAASVLANTDAPDITVTLPDMLDCNTSQVTLSGGVQTPGNYLFSWSTQNGNILSGANSQMPIVSEAGTYTLIVTDTQNGCTNEEDVVVLVDPATPSGVNLQVRDVACYGYTNGAMLIESVQGGTPPFQYSVDNSPLSSTVLYTALAPGSYPLYILDANGCEFETNFVVLEPAELIVDLGPDTTIRLGQSLQLSLDNTVNYPDRVAQLDVKPVDLLAILLCDTCNLTPTYSFQYRVTVVDSNGCSATDSRLVIVDKTRNVYIPNIFNPELGSENGLFMIYGGDDVLEIKSFQVFNRWGELVHEYFSFAPNYVPSAWDGTFRGQKSSPGVYVYYAEILFKDGEVILYKGDVTLMR